MTTTRPGPGRGVLRRVSPTTSSRTGSPSTPASSTPSTTSTRTWGRGSARRRCATPGTSPRRGSRGRRRPRRLTWPTDFRADIADHHRADADRARHRGQHRAAGGQRQAAASSCCPTRRTLELEGAPHGFLATHPGEVNEELLGVLSSPGRHLESVSTTAAGRYPSQCCPAAAPERSVRGDGGWSALLAGRSWTVLTGAGMSTDSGIPDYRGPTSVRATPMQYREFVGSHAAPAALLGALLPGLATDRTRRPNAGHRALVELEDAGLAGVVTQNVDGLHAAAGSSIADQPARRDRLGDLPGLRARSPRTELQERLERLNPDVAGPTAARARRAAARRRRGGARLARLRARRLPPCGGRLKPDVVFFGEIRAAAPGRRCVRAGRGGRGAGRGRLLADGDVGAALRPAPHEARPRRW